jgi:hypothetical protein
MHGRIRRFPALLVVAAVVASTTVAMQIARPTRAHAATYPVIERNWVRVSGTPQPPSRGTMSYDQARHQTVLFVPGSPGQTWVFDGGTRRWTQLFPATNPTLQNASAAYDADTATTVMFASNAGVDTCNPSVMGETWEWNGSDWTRLHPAHAPDECAGLHTNRITYDAARRQIVMTAGNGYDATWIWNGTDWSNPAGAPNGSAIAYDPVSKRVISFGGYLFWHGDNDFGDTQAWDGTKWRTLDKGGAKKDPAARGYASMVFDPVLNSLVLFGGMATHPTQHYLGDTWRWSGAHWIRMGTRASPPPTAFSPFVYDTDHNTAVLLDGGTWLFTAGIAGGGYFAVMRNGGVFAFGDAQFRGGLGKRHLQQPIVGMARTPTRKGYWLVNAKGRIFTFGDAHSYGSTANIHLHRPIVAIVATPSGLGYWLVASDGGVFTFGDARFFGGTGGRRLANPIVGMTPTPSGGGYWLVAADGGIFTFGDAHFFGSGPQITPRLDRPVVGMAANPTGTGYWIVTRDGGVFYFGTPASIFTNRSPSGTIVAIAASPTGRGYWLFSDAGQIEAFGDAQPHGSVRRPIAQPVVGGLTT